MQLPPKIRRLLFVLACLAFGGGLAFGYYTLLDHELAGYRMHKSQQLDENKIRDLRRRMIVGVPAMRERILRAEFGDLPESPEINTDLRLVALWQKWLGFVFFFFAAGGFFYLLFWKKKSWRRKLPLVLMLWLGLSQALPLLLLPDEAAKAFKLIGMAIIPASLLYLTIDSLVDRYRARRFSRQSIPA